LRRRRLLSWQLLTAPSKPSQERRQAVIDKCTAADPRHGPVWQTVAKDLANLGKPISEILRLVAAKLQ
jgi:pre-mRNA-processing factor 6